MFSGKSLGAKSTHKKSLFAHFNVQNIEITDIPTSRASSRLKEKGPITYEEETEQEIVDALEIVETMKTHHDVVEMIQNVNNNKPRNTTDQGTIDLTNSTPAVLPKLTVLDMMKLNSTGTTIDLITSDDDVCTMSSDPISKLTHLQIVDDPAMDSELLELIGEEADDETIQVTIKEEEIEDIKVDDETIQEGIMEAPNLVDTVEEPEQETMVEEQVVSKNDDLDIDLPKPQRLLGVIIPKPSSNKNEDLIIYRLKKGKLESLTTPINYYYHPFVMQLLSNYHQSTKSTTLPTEYHLLIPLLSLECQYALKSLLPYLKQSLKNPLLLDSDLKAIIKSTMIRNHYGVELPCPMSLRWHVWEWQTSSALFQDIPSDLQLEIINRQSMRIHHKQCLDAFIANLSNEHRALFLSGHSKWHINIHASGKQTPIAPPHEKKKRVASAPATLEQQPTKKQKITQPIVKNTLFQHFKPKHQEIENEDIVLVNQNTEQPQGLFSKSMQYQHSIHSTGVCINKQQELDAILKSTPNQHISLNAWMLELQQQPCYATTQCNNPHVIQTTDELTQQQTRLYRKTIIIHNSQIADVVDLIWDQSSKFIKGTCPFTMDPLHCQYDVDSDVEMDFNNDDDDDDDADSQADSNVDEDSHVDDSFAVPHGYLSEGEGGGSQCSMLEEDDAQQDTTKKKGVLLKPFTSTFMYTNEDGVDNIRDKSCLTLYYGNL